MGSPMGWPMGQRVGRAAQMPAPPYLPAALLERIHAETVRAVRKPETQETIKTMAFEPWTMTPAEFRTFLRSDYARWGTVVKAANIKPE